MDIGADISKKDLGDIPSRPQEKRQVVKVSSAQVLRP
jgi:hypothetical protein